MLDSRAETAADLRAILEEVVAGANASVAHTPDLLPILKQAGVVDAGGKGLAVMLDGMLRYLRGQRLDESAEPPPVPLDLAAVGAASQIATIETPKAPATRPCGNCGLELSSKVMFCRRCGTRQAGPA